ncbi:MAG: biotin--[acetyl-CoA-carboxylase] ligase [Gemmatimonadota bacterium]
MDNRLSRILEENQGQFVSGQEIGRRLGTSRAAVWKRVQTLRRRGFGIEGARGAGYRLLGRPDVIEEADLRSRLGPRSIWKAFHILAVTDSTNSRAVALAEAGAPHGTVVCADAQTGGRGRFGRTWESPPGLNLYVSFLLRPSLEPLLAPQLTLVTAVALAAAVEASTGLSAGLKWPNDLYLGGRKAAGILAEMSADADRLRHVVIGTGLNVNAGIADFPPALRGRATSLRIQGGRGFPRAEVLARFLDSFSEVYGAYVAEGLRGVLPEWRRRSLLDGKRVVVRLRGEDAPGTALGVDDAGLLLFRRDGGRETEKLAGGEIVAFGE